MRTKAPIKMAAAGTATRKSKLRFDPYQTDKPRSSLKFQIGELLLFGDSQQRNFWERFESRLRLYADLQKFRGHYE